METIIIKSAIRHYIYIAPINYERKENTIGNWRVSLGSGVSVLPALPFSVPRVRPTLYWTWNAIDRASDTSWVIQLEHGVAICMLSYIYIYIFMYIQLYIVDCPFRLCAHYSPRGLARGRSLIGISKIELDHFKDHLFERKWERAKRAFKNVFVRTGRKASRPKKKKKNESRGCFKNDRLMCKQPIVSDDLDELMNPFLLPWTKMKTKNSMISVSMFISSRSSFEFKYVTWIYLA